MFMSIFDNGDDALVAVLSNTPFLQNCIVWLSIRLIIAPSGNGTVTDVPDTAPEPFILPVPLPPERGLILLFVDVPVPTSLTVEDVLVLEMAKRCAEF